MAVERTNEWARSFQMARHVDSQRLRHGLAGTARTLSTFRADGRCAVVWDVDGPILVTHCKLNSRV